MINRRLGLTGLAGLGGLAAMGAARGGPSILRLERTDAGPAAIRLPELVAGEACALRGRVVLWRGRFLGFLPGGHAGRTCRIASAGLDADGMSDVRVELG